MLDSTLHVLKTIGLPFTVEGNRNFELTPETLHTACTNKVSLLYFERLLKLGKIDSNNVELNTLRRRHQDILELSVLLARVFRENRINYTLFKTLRPFDFAGADVDVLVETQQNFLSGVNALQANGFEIKGQESFDATLSRGDFEVTVDLQTEIAVSSLPYLNKSEILRHTKLIKINNSMVKTLDACAEIVVSASHAFYKEHMFTLSDFYSISLWSKQIDPRELIKLAEETESRTAVACMMQWVQDVASAAFNVQLPKIDETLRKIDQSSLCHVMFSKESLDLPFRVPKSVVALSLADKIFRDKYTRSNLISALFQNVSYRQLRTLISHFNRERY